jgi:hypothetical protein
MTVQGHPASMVVNVRRMVAVVQVDILEEIVKF